MRVAQHFPTICVWRCSHSASPKKGSHTLDPRRSRHGIYTSGFIPELFELRCRKNKSLGDTCSLTGLIYCRKFVGLISRWIELCRSKLRTCYRVSLSSSRGSPSLNEIGRDVASASLWEMQIPMAMPPHWK